MPHSGFVISHSDLVIRHFISDLQQSTQLPCVGGVPAELMAHRPDRSPLLPATVLPRACLCSLCSQLCITKLLMMRPVKPETAQRCRRSSCRTGPTAALLVPALHAWQARYNDRTQRCRANEDLLCNRRASCPSLNHSRQFRRVAGLGYRLLSAWSRVRVPPPAPDAGVAQW